MTKAYTFTILASVLLMVQACDQHPASTITTSTPTGASPPKSADLQSQVLDAAESEWSKVWIQDGDTWISRNKSGRYLLQVKGRHAKANAESISDADRLNGVQWHGYVAFGCVAERKFGFVSDDGGLNALVDHWAKYKAGWNEWYTAEGAIGIYKFTKQHDNWTLEKDGNEFLRLQQGLDEMERPTAADLRHAQPTR